MSASPGTGVPSDRAGSSTVRPGADADPGHNPAVPARADGLELLGELPGSGYRTPPALARRVDGQTIQLTRLLHLVLQAVDGQRDHQDIADSVSTAYGRLVTADMVRRLLEEKLQPLGLLRRPDGTQPTVRKAQPLLALRLRYVVSDPHLTRRVTAPFAVLFQPLVVVAVLAAFGVVCWWLLFDKGLASATYQAFDRPELLLTVFGLTVLSAGFHEFGHAAAARYGGATPGAMGVGLYLVWPAFYTDVTDSYRLGRGGRVRTDLGGLYFNTIVALAMYGVWAVTRWDALLLIIATQVLQMVRQLTPLVRFDGYHVLADLTGVPDLYHRIKPTLLGLLPGRRGNAESRLLKPWARAVVTAWVLLVVPVLALSLTLIVLALPRVLATAWASLGRQVHLLDAQFAEGDFAAVGVRLLSVVAIALPVAGIGYMLVRAARRWALGIWRATRGRPARQVTAGVALAAAAVLLAIAWWPHGDNYRPIQPYERGTVADALPLASHGPAGPGQGLREGRGGTARAVWPGTPAVLPTADRPQLALLMTPHPGAAAPQDAPSWVFPFDRPLPPAEGGNQALAVNTTDGTIVYDVAFALVWADTGDAVLNRNEAHAYASCTGCAAVAVAFQVVLVIGQADVVVPQNLAVSATYHCVSCLTYALATQLVLTLPGELSPSGTAELTAVWNEIAAFGQHIAGVPLSELRARLTEFEARIADIVTREATAPTAGPPATGATAIPGTGIGGSTSGQDTAEPVAPATTGTPPAPAEPPPTTGMSTSEPEPPTSTPEPTSSAPPTT